jgi:AbrB family looped-hinge helix DNA binding protein
MAPARSRLTAQAQVSVPARIRRKLGLAPGSVLEWDDDGVEIVVRRVGRFTSEDVHRQLFAARPKRKTLKELRAGIRRHVKARHAGS